MDHMPYESMEVGGELPGAGPGHDAPSPYEAPHPYEDPGRTPHSAEGDDEDSERQLPQEEPGKTPGSAEGEDEDEPIRH